MESQPNPTTLGEWARSVDPWVWPITAAIVVGGILLFSSGASLFWLALHPAERATVIWIPPANTQSTIPELPVAARQTVAPGNPSNAHAN